MRYKATIFDSIELYVEVDNYRMEASSPDPKLGTPLFKIKAHGIYRNPVNKLLRAPVYKTKPPGLCLNILGSL